MAQTTLLQPPTSAEQSSTCSQCPLFEDYKETRGRGYCRAFDSVVRRHHQRTTSCDLVLKKSSSQPKTIKVSLITDNYDDGDGHPVCDEIIIDLTVFELSWNAVNSALALRDNLQSYQLVSFWEPQKEDEF